VANPRRLTYADDVVSLGSVSASTEKGERLGFQPPSY
jgi:hypothetical protein